MAIFDKLKAVGKILQEAGPEGEATLPYGVNKIMGIDVLDHIIITKTKVFSFKEKKLI